MSPKVQAGGRGEICQASPEAKLAGAARLKWEKIPSTALRAPSPKGRLSLASAAGCARAGAETDAL